MPELSELFCQRRDQFVRDVSAMPDAKAATDLCARYIGDVRRDRLSAAPDAHLRIRLGELAAAAEAGAALMVAVSQVDIRLALPNRIDPPARRRRLSRGAVIRALPLALCALLAAWLLLEGELPASVLALAAGGASAFSLVRLSPPKRQVLPDVAGEARVDPVELARRMEHLFARMDELLGARQAEAEGPLLLTGGLMESVQMLMEAKLQSDGQFALKALPQMISALEGQGIEIELYSADRRANFDLLAAPVGGETIRPALLKDGKLLVRGQATVKG